MLKGYGLVRDLCAELQDFMRQHDFKSIDEFRGGEHAWCLVGCWDGSGRRACHCLALVTGEVMATGTSLAPCESHVRSPHATPPLIRPSHPPPYDHTSSTLTGKALPYFTTHHELVRMQREAIAEKKAKRVGLSRDDDWSGDGFVKEAESMVAQ